MYLAELRLPSRSAAEDALEAAINKRTCYNNVYPFGSKFHITAIPTVLKGSIGDMGVVAARPRKANELYSHSLR